MHLQRIKFVSSQQSFCPPNTTGLTRGLKRLQSLDDRSLTESFVTNGCPTGEKLLQVVNKEFDDLFKRRSEKGVIEEKALLLKRLIFDTGITKSDRDNILKIFITRLATKGDKKHKNVLLDGTSNSTKEADKYKLGMLELSPFIKCLRVFIALLVSSNRTVEGNQEFIREFLELAADYPSVKNHINLFASSPILYEDGLSVKQGSIFPDEGVPRRFEILQDGVGGAPGPLDPTVQRTAQTEHWVYNLDDLDDLDDESFSVQNGQPKKGVPGRFEILQDGVGGAPVPLEPTLQMDGQTGNWDDESFSVENGQRKKGVPVRFGTLPDGVGGAPAPLEPPFQWAVRLGAVLARVSHWERFSGTKP